MRLEWTARFLAVLALAGLLLLAPLAGQQQAAPVTLPAASASDLTFLGALQQVLKLLAAAVMGILVTVVHKYYHRDRPLPRSLEQAQVLLCVAGALMMIIIGDSFARAFGVAGGASIIRFRTPVEDPKDTTILFLVLGLGMSCGMGIYWVGAMGTMFVCLFLVVLDYFGETKPRTMMLEVIAVGPEFPSEHVHRVLGATADFYEAREVATGEEAMTKYHVTLSPQASLSYLSQQLLSGGTAGVKSVSWEAPKKSG